MSKSCDPLVLKRNDYLKKYIYIYVRVKFLLVLTNTWKTYITSY